ncbi:MAG: hypothetical protein ACLGI3_08945 [Actinomycetes bacterium]
MDVNRRGSPQHHDEGLPAWVLPVCLVLTAVACALLLRFALGVMSEEQPGSTPTSASLTAAP